MNRCYSSLLLWLLCCSTIHFEPFSDIISPQKNITRTSWYYFLYPTLSFTLNYKMIKNIILDTIHQSSNIFVPSGSNWSSELSGAACLSGYVFSTDPPKGDRFESQWSCVPWIQLRVACSNPSECIFIASINVFSVASTDSLVLKCQ